MKAPAFQVAVIPVMLAQVLWRGSSYAIGAAWLQRLRAPLSIGQQTFLSPRGRAASRVLALVSTVDNARPVSSVGTMMASNRQDPCAELRQATRRDVDAMHRVRLAVRENVLSSPTRISSSDYVSAIEETGRGWVVEYDREVVAFVVGNAVDGNVWALFVHPDYEGRGIGKRLNETVVEWLRARGVQRLWLTTDPNSRAAGFYASAGWRDAGVTPGGELIFELDGSLQ